MSDEEDEFNEAEDLPIFEEEDEEEELFEEEAPAPVAEEEEPVEEEAAEEPAGETFEAEEPAVSVGEVPMTLTVELGRLKMSADRLLQMQPGNLVELATPSGGPVDLVVNGKRIGKGELMKVGEVLGVRILEI